MNDHKNEIKTEQESLEARREEMLCALVQDPAYRPMKLKELAILLDVPKERRKELRDTLDGLVRQGKLGVSPRGKYGKPELFSECGIFQGNSRGFGFVTVEGREQDVFIPEEKTGQAMDGDEVRISIEKEETGKRPEGRVLKVLRHANTELVGLYRKNRSFGFVIPDNQRITKDIFVPQGCDLGAVSGHKVVVRLSSYGGEGRKPEGEILQEFPSAGDI